MIRSRIFDGKRWLTRFLGRTIATGVQEVNLRNKLEPKICGVYPEIKENMLTVRWTDGFESHYPFVWLLDNAKFVQGDYLPYNRRNTSKGFNRDLSLNELNFEAQPQHLTLSQDGNQISIRWPPYREAIYESIWLKDHAILSREKDNVKIWNRIDEIQTWGREISRFNLPCIEASHIADGNILALNGWTQFKRIGIMLIKKFIQNPQAAVQMFPNNSQANIPKPVTQVYGQQYKSLRTTGLLSSFQMSTPNFALIVAQGRTTDNKAGLQIVDGFKIAKLLCNLQPSEFTLLSQNEIAYVDESDPNSKLIKRPLFSLNRTGDVVSVAFDNDLRSSKFSPKHDVTFVKKFYHTLKIFNWYCYHPENLAHLSLQHGDAVLLDNNRVLHGNSACRMEKDEDLWLEEYLLGDSVLRAFRDNFLEG